MSTVSPVRHRLSHVAESYAESAMAHGGVRIVAVEDIASLMALFIIGVQYGGLLARRGDPVIDELLQSNDGESAAATTANLAFILGRPL